MPSLMSRLRSLFTKKTTTPPATRTNKPRKKTSRQPPPRPRETLVDFPYEVKLLAARARYKIERGKDPTPEEWQALYVTMGETPPKPVQSTRRPVNALNALNKLPNARKGLVKKNRWSNNNFAAAVTYANNARKSGSKVPPWGAQLLHRLNQEWQARTEWPEPSNRPQRRQLPVEKKPIRNLVW